MEGKVRIGLIGAGGIAGAHVAGYRRNPDTVVFAAIADPVRESAERRRGDDEAVTIYDDYRTMIAEADLDAVDICLPHHLHAEAIVAAAEAGLHVLCEKPLCMTKEEAERIAEVAARTGVTIMCAHNQLFLPTVAEARRLIDEGTFGRVYEVRTTDSFYNDFTPESMGWRANAATAGGGELIDTGYHPLYLLQHLAGGVPTEVTAMLSRHRLEFMEGEDSAQVLVRYDNGVVGHVTTSWAYEAAPGTEKFSLVGERGSLTSDGVTLTYRVRGEEPVTSEFEPVHDIAAEVEHFARSLLTGSRPLHTHVEGIDVLGVILAAYESDRTRAVAPVHRIAAPVH
ncbi:Gfo/Idh/MocA family protein [Microbacterium sp. T2.11-28]|uniref:Gfo/Idh/MocA family protein n=1 Tax=Microbacterium sp. T2.11-28 TaxID=3041169 RepID=UPI00247790FC|nr:Gfo/Idh/MocA family oxidoreductase [Microbacterium sp. T2.11-28]CAI9390691.1 Glucose--fructose oxidoreductase [Microbacterium sp. T2.11-28]